MELEEEFASIQILVASKSYPFLSSASSISGWGRVDLNKELRLSKGSRFSVVGVPTSVSWIEESSEVEVRFDGSSLSRVAETG